MNGLVEPWVSCSTTDLPPQPGRVRLERHPIPSGRFVQHWKVEPLRQAVNVPIYHQSQTVRRLTTSPAGMLIDVVSAPQLFLAIPEATPLHRSNLRGKVGLLVLRLCRWHVSEAAQGSITLTCWKSCQS